MNFVKIGRWEDAETGEVLLDQLFVAATFWQRLRGLQFARPLPSGSGLLLRDCRSVHTMWMRFPIDAVFLDDEMTVLEVRREIKPWRVVIPKTKEAAHVIEMTSGWEDARRVGQRTEVSKA